MNEQQIIEAALKDAGIPSAQAAAYRLLLRCAEQLSAMENLKNEEASGGRTAVTPSPDQPAPGLDPRVEQISRGHDGVWRAYGHNVNGKWWDLLIESTNLADLVGVLGANDNIYATLGELQIENSKLRERVEAQARQISHMFEMGDEADKKHAAQVDALINDRDEARRTRNAAQAECNRLLGAKRRLEDEMDATREGCKAMRSKFDTAAMVRQFNRKFGVPIADVPAFPARDRMNLRVRLLAEEFCEFLTECGYTYTVNVSRGSRIFVCDYSSYTLRNPDMIAAADGLADMQYVIEGTALEFGIPLAAVFAEVHRSNMTKTGLPDSGGKITKGEGYEPPKIEDILREHGWEG